MKFKGKTEKKKGLTSAQGSFFLLGYTLKFWGDPEFPFKSESQREALWCKFKEQLLGKIYQPHDEFETFRAPGTNQLRPSEWWREAPEKKKVFNGAVRLGDEDRLWDRMPLMETDLEFLSRLNLLTKEDIDKSKTESFKEQEKEDLEFRDYCLELGD